MPISALDCHHNYRLIAVVTMQFQRLPNIGLCPTRFAPKYMTLSHIYPFSVFNPSKVLSKTDIFYLILLIVDPVYTSCPTRRCAATERITQHPRDRHCPPSLLPPAYRHDFRRGTGTTNSGGRSTQPSSYTFFLKCAGDFNEIFRSFLYSNLALACLCIRVMCRGIVQSRHLHYLHIIFQYGSYT